MANPAVPITVGEMAIFRDGGSGLPKFRDGQPVTVVHKWSNEEKAEYFPELHCTDVYDVEFSDGEQYTAFETELTPQST